MFLGHYTPRLDDKGRLILPARFRDVLKRIGSDELVITPGQEGCLYVYPYEEFQEIHARMRAQASSSAAVRHIERFMLSSAHLERPDSQGRVTIPAHLRDKAELEKDLLVAGVGQRFEIWSVPRWEDYQEEQSEALAQVQEEIFL